MEKLLVIGGLFLIIVGYFAHLIGWVKGHNQGLKNGERKRKKNTR